MHGGRVVYQFGDYKMEVNPAVETTSDHSRRTENLGSGLRAEYGPFVPGSPESNAKGTEKEEDGLGRSKRSNNHKQQKETDEKTRNNFRRSFGEKRLKELQKEAKRIDGEIRAKKGESRIMKKITAPSKFLLNTMELLQNEVRHLGCVVVSLEFGS